MMVGVLGAGQLGRMLALAGVPMGLRFRFLDHTPGAPASVLGAQVVAEFEDGTALDRFSEGLDVCTLEFENVPVGAVEDVARRVPVFPGALALATAQDRLLEKECFSRLGIATTRYCVVSTRADLDAAVRDVGLPAVLKSRRMGYDGKGQAMVRNASPRALDEAWNAVDRRECLLEEFVAFEYEASMIGVRARDGSCVFYPLTRNHHAEGILRWSVAPCDDPSGTLAREAREACRNILEHLGYVGTLAVEFFVRSGRLVANEMAPRVHNSGHWTIEGSACSQFENHLRAVCGLALGDPAPCVPSAMVNLIGHHPPLNVLALLPGARVHLYGKEARAGRKLGHVTITDPDPSNLQRRFAALSNHVGMER